MNHNSRRHAKVWALCCLLALMLATLGLSALVVFNPWMLQGFASHAERSAQAGLATLERLGGTPGTMRLALATAVPGALFAALACVILLVVRSRRRRRTPIPWPSNGHATKAIQTELTFQQLLIQLQTRLTQMEDKVDSLETLMMKRALQSE